MRALLLAVLLTGCAGAGQGCSEAGASPFVRVSAADVPGAQVRVCADGECAQAPWRAAEGAALVPLDLPPGERVALAVAVLDAGGAVLDEDRVEAEVELFAPNGPDCPPQVGVVDLRRQDGGYVQGPAPESG